MAVPFPAEWVDPANMSSLQHLVCTGCQLSFALPDTLASLSQLSYLDLSNNSLMGGSIPAAFSSSVLQTIKVSK